MQDTLAVWCVILGGVMVWIPALLLVLMVVMSRTEVDWDRHPWAFWLLILLVAALRVWYAPAVVFTLGSLLLAYGVAALAHASRPATLSAMGIALLCSILLWGGVYLVRMLHERRRRGRPPHEITC